MLYSTAFQGFIALCLFTNFALNIIETELKPDEEDDLAYNLKYTDQAFSLLYFFELSANLFVNRWDFFKDGWSIFDAFCVLSGIVGEIMKIVADSGTDMSMLRTIRIFKIIRIFSRLKELQKIVLAIMSTIIPLFNTFIIYMVVVSIYSVLATQLFGDVFPLRFGTFSKASLTMFQISTGDGWLTDVLRPLLSLQAEKYGISQDSWNAEMVGSVFFMCSFILLVMVSE